VNNRKSILIRRFYFILFGFFASLIIIELCLRLTGWVYFIHDSLREKANIEKVFGKDSIRILCLGPCYTLGVGVPVEYTYPKYLEKILNEKYPEKKIAVINKGERGKNLFFFVKNLERYIAEYRPHVVILNINSRINFYSKDFVAKKNLSFGLIKHKIKRFISGFRIYKVLELFFSKKKYNPEEYFNTKNTPLKESAQINKENVYEKEISSLESALKNNPKDSRSLTKLVYAYLSQGLYEEAIEAVKKAIELVPQEARNYFKLFFIYCEAGKYDLAVQTQKKALEVNPQIAADIHDKILRTEEELSGNINIIPKVYTLMRYYASLGEYKKSAESFYKYQSKFKDGNNKMPRDCKAIMRLYIYLNKNTNSSQTLGERLFEEDYVVLPANQKWRRISGKKIDSYGKQLEDKRIFASVMQSSMFRLKKISKKYHTPVVLENMGSVYEQQEIIKESCAVFDIPFVDLFSFFKNIPDRKRFFLYGLYDFRLNKEGNELVAIQVYEKLRDSGILYPIIKKR